MLNKEKLFYLLSRKNLVSLKILGDDISIKTKELINAVFFMKKNTLFLITATAVDQINKINRFLLVYIFSCYNKPLRVYVNVNTNLQIGSIANIFPSANFLEREIYDLFGVFFINIDKSNDLRRILTDYHFKGHPLRKDFSLIGYNEKVFSYLTKTIRTKTDVIF